MPESKDLSIETRIKGSKIVTSIEEHDVFTAIKPTKIDMWEEEDK